MLKSTQVFECWWTDELMDAWCKPEFQCFSFLLLPWTFLPEHISWTSSHYDRGHRSARSLADETQSLMSQASHGLQWHFSWNANTYLMIWCSYRIASIGWANVFRSIHFFGFLSSTSSAASSRHHFWSLIALSNERCSKPYAFALQHIRP